MYIAIIDNEHQAFSFYSIFLKSTGDTMQIVMQVLQSSDVTGLTELSKLFSDLNLK
jgi:hypothetical protein